MQGFKGIGESLGIHELIVRNNNIVAHRPFFFNSPAVDNLVSIECCKKSDKSVLLAFVFYKKRKAVLCEVWRVLTHCLLPKVLSE
jgi:hypothetical protein